MYRLPQSGILAQKLLEKRLNEKGYRQSSLTLVYWKHNLQPIYFKIFVENNCMKYFGKEHAKHLFTTLNEHYIVSQDWEGVI